jgi:N-methylhydantoinase B
MPNDLAAHAVASAPQGARAGRPDPIVLERVRNALAAAVAEMAQTLERAAYSADATQDASVGLFDAEARAIVQSQQAAPTSCAGLGPVVRKGAALFSAEGFQPGDVVVSNDAEAGGGHAAAVVVFSPVFSGTELVAFAAARLRWPDIGGMSIGSAPARPRDAFSEGVQLPYLKAWRAGAPDEGILRVIQANTRFPERVMGDVQAQVLACQAGGRRYVELLARHGRERMTACVQRLWEEAEALARRAVSAIPDGTYEASCVLDDDGVDAARAVALAVKVIVAGSEMTIDFTGMPEQVAGPCNSRAAHSIAQVAFKLLTTPRIPASEGAFRNLTVVCPEGRIVSAHPSAPRGGSGAAIATAIDLVVRALGDALPAGVAAGNPDNTALAALSARGERAGTVFHSALGYLGGWGASGRADGASAVPPLGHGPARLVPVEVQETSGPVRVHRLALRPDSGGPGRQRGGLGIELEREALAECSYHGRYERTRDAPWGLGGGEPGATTSASIRRGGEEIAPPAKCEYFPLSKGDVETVRTAGGGGFGAPSERDPERVRRDVIEGYVTRDAARERYGVVISEKTLAIDAEATAKRREKMRAALSAASAKPAASRPDSP